MATVRMLVDKLNQMGRVLDLLFGSRSFKSEAAITIDNGPTCFMNLLAELVGQSPVLLIARFQPFRSEGMNPGWCGLCLKLGGAIGGW